MSSAPRVAALYRYPMKGFTSEPRESLEVLASGRVGGDRVLGLRFADAGEPQAQAVGDDWWLRGVFMVLLNTPSLASLRLTYDEARRHLAIARAGEPGEPLVGASLDEPGGRERIAEAVAVYVLEQDEQPLTGHPERLPLHLIGDGETARYQDNRMGLVTLHSRASVQSLGDALDASDFDERRFRSNIAIEGIEAWEEFDWVGRGVRIGEVEFDVEKTLTRCVATHANPSRGVRDEEVLTTLTGVLGHEKPSFGIGMLPRGAGEIRLGDEVALLD